MQPPLLEVILSDPLLDALYRVHRNDCHSTQEKFLEDCVRALAEQKKMLAEKVAELTAIAPRRVRLPDGGLKIFRVPEDDIPVTLF